MTDKPSKESVERAHRFNRDSVDGVLLSEDIERLALEFDAILKDHEQDCDYLRGFNAGRREAAQQNVALVEALRRLCLDNSPFF